MSVRDRKTQELVVLQHLRTYGAITNIEAYEMHGITRLSNVIHAMRKKGIEIETEKKETVNRYGYKVSYAVYKLKDKDGLKSIEQLKQRGFDQ